MCYRLTNSCLKLGFSRRVQSIIQSEIQNTLQIQWNVPSLWKEQTVPSFFSLLMKLVICVHKNKPLLITGTLKLKKFILYCALEQNNHCIRLVEKLQDPRYSFMSMLIVPACRLEEIWKFRAYFAVCKTKWKQDKH